MSKQLRSSQEAVDVAIHHITNISACNTSWMAMVMCVDASGEVHLKRVTWNFPHSKMPKAVRVVRDNLVSEAFGDPLPDDPLPVADSFADKVADALSDKVGAMFKARPEVCESIGGDVAGAVPTRPRDEVPGD